MPREAEFDDMQLNFFPLGFSYYTAELKELQTGCPLLVQWHSHPYLQSR